MTYLEKEEEKGDYLIIKGCERDDVEAGSGGCGRTRRSMWNWVKLCLVVLFICVVVCVALLWVAPYLMKKVVYPLINWMTRTLSRPTLAILVFSSVAIFPALCLPSTPSMWVAGISFGYVYGFLLLFPALAVGVSLPYFIGSLFNHKVQEWLETYPKNALFLRSAGEGDWIIQLKSVTLIRLSPVPYVFYNYCSVATGVKYCPYIIGSLLGILPDIFVTIYSGILIRKLADASHKQESLSPSEIAIDVIGFLVATTSGIICAIYAKRKLKALQAEDEPLLQ